MYLETILILTQQHGAVRSVDVSEYMNFSKPSVSRAIGLLKSGGYVLMDRNGFLTLTESGLEIAKKIYERHELLTLFLLYNVRLFALTTLVSFAVFALFYALVYRFTSNAYYNIVSSADEQRN